MQQTDEIKALIQQWITEHFPLAKDSQIGATDSLFDSGIVDSLGTLEIVMFLEEKFALVVDDEDMVADHFETIQSIATFVESKRIPEPA